MNINLLISIRNRFLDHDLKVRSSGHGQKVLRINGSARNKIPMLLNWKTRHKTMVLKIRVYGMKHISL